MDTKLRKSSKLAKVIIALCVMLPALLLVSLYPTMEQAMLNERAEYEKIAQEEQEDHSEWVILHPVVNYAMENNIYSREANGYKCRIYKGIIDILFGYIHNDNQALEIFKTWV